MPGTPSTDSERGPRAARAKIVYVMGAGRSGSTILGVALGNCENVFFAGELDRWLARSGVPRPQRRGAELWSRIRAGVQDPEAELEGKTTYLERSSALLDVRKWPARRRLRRAYRRISQELYLSIAHVTGATHIVDTSHYPLRARELQSLTGVDLYLVLLVRDPRAVAASLGRRDRRRAPLRPARRERLHMAHPRALAAGVPTPASRSTRVPAPRGLPRRSSGGPVSASRAL